MNPSQEKLELFRGLEVSEVEERAQHETLSSCSD